MGLVGIALGGAVLVGYKVQRLVALVAFGALEIAAWYVFLVFVFIVPGMDATNVAPADQYPFTSQLVYNTFVMAGILSSAFYCGALPAHAFRCALTVRTATLLGGQLSFAWYLVRLSASEDIGDGNYWRTRASYYSALVLLTGIFILVAGGCATSVDPGPHRISAPPVFVIYSGIPIATGCLAIATGAVGVLATFLPPGGPMALVLIVLTALNCLWQLAVMALYQPPAQGNTVAAVPVAILIISQLLPLYFHLRRGSYLASAASHPLELKTFDSSGVMLTSPKPQ